MRSLPAALPLATALLLHLLAPSFLVAEALAASSTSAGGRRTTGTGGGGGKVTVVVAGATGRVGSRLIRSLRQRSAVAEGEESGDAGCVPVGIVALVRNATKARSMFCDDDDDDDFGDGGSDSAASSSSPSSSSVSRSPKPLPHVDVVEADYADAESVEAAFRAISEKYGGGGGGEGGGGGDVRLFLSCGNVPNQATLEKNVIRAAAAASAERRGAASFCVKLSTAAPVLESGTGGGGPYAAHSEVEDFLLRGEFCDDGDGGGERRRKPPPLPTAVLRPNLFLQALSEPNPLLGVNVRDSDETTHPLAGEDMAFSAIDCADVADCAASILLCKDPIAAGHGGSIYELTGPEAIRLGVELADAISSLRLRPVRISGCDLDERCEALGMPPAAAKGLASFLGILGRYDKVTDDVKVLTGRSARSVSDFVESDPVPFLPRTYRKLVGKGRAASFREAARIVEDASLDDDHIRLLAPDEILIRVQVAGVNGGADTFACTRADDDAVDFPLGNEGAGVVVAVGSAVSTGLFDAGDTAVFVAPGAYGEYVRANASRCVNASRLCPGASPAELTALRISALTALVALERTAPVKEGDTVLVTACCGGTGHFAVQIAKNAGATVIGTVGSPAKVQTASDLGVDRVVDTSAEDLAQVLTSEFPDGLDVVYDGVGGPLLRAAYENLAEGGRILVVGSISQYPHNKDEDVQGHGIDDLGDIMDIFRSGKTVTLDDGNKQIIGNVWGDLFGSDEMARYRDGVFELHREGKLRAVVDSTPFRGVDAVCDAVEHMLSRGSVGKVCVRISD